MLVAWYSAVGLLNIDVKWATILCAISVIRPIYSIMFAFAAIPDFTCVEYETEIAVFSRNRLKQNQRRKTQNSNNTRQ